ncbi:MAG: four helix bundle protein [bacterium]
MSSEFPISNDQSGSTRIYDLTERTARFGEDVIDFVNSLGKNDINRVLGNQVLRSGTGIGANYMDADEAESKKDFQHKIALCKKEAKETMHWLRMIVRANSSRAEDCKKLSQEAGELVRIFSRSLLTSRKKSN